MLRNVAHIKIYESKDISDLPAIIIMEVTENIMAIVFADSIVIDFPVCCYSTWAFKGRDNRGIIFILRTLVLPERSDVAEEIWDL